MLIRNFFPYLDLAGREREILFKCSDLLRKPFLQAHDALDLIVDVLEANDEIDFCMIHYCVSLDI